MPAYKTFVVGRIGGIADADQQALGREQSAAAAPFDRLPGDLNIRAAAKLVGARDMAHSRRWLAAVVAADADHRVAGFDRIAGRHKRATITGTPGRNVTSPTSRFRS